MSTEHRGHATRRSANGRYLADNWHQGTFPNRTQSVNYHLAKHGKGQSATEYTRDAMDFFQKNRHLGQEVVLKDGTAGIKIQTKISVPGQKTQKGRRLLDERRQAGDVLGLNYEHDD